ncbi:hypothetical protein [Pseudomonas granadensis]|uniref:hypothetical protein n=1 Tax=Pseudomonas granadensis TaxID=1421430 RepID=UPI000879BA91|nr:hypothetical protein [Pseudomonas granadensis]SDT47922.1 hypothetical protein SAMN05216579_3997 [Pseudomonas granadensis]
MKTITTGCALSLGLLMSTAQAASQEIRATFRPDPSQPSKNIFINQTPNSGYCAAYPGQCADNAMFSIQLPVRFTSNGAIKPHWGVGLKVPANWRQLTVTNADTQETEIVEVRIIGIGSNYVLSDPAHELAGVSDVLEGHQSLWDGSSWVYASTPCQYSGVGAYTPISYRFFWKAPVEAYCTKKTRFGIPSMYFDTLDFAYELRTPNPLGMSSGLYTGSMDYSVGNGGDFDIGGGFRPDDDSLTLDFVLDVQHTLKIDLPPGGNNVTLEPEGGWARWINSGRKPNRIFRDQPFHISASSRFKVMLLCNSPGNNICRLGSPKGNSTEILVSMTLPPGITHSGGLEVVRLPLRNNNWIGPFQPGLYLDRKPGAIHFEMMPRVIEDFLRPGMNDRLRGNVTVIWDSEA